MRDKALMSLADLKRGQSGKVVRINTGNPAFRKRLFDMGLTEGVHVKMKRVAPLGDPLNITIRGYELCLRKEDLMHIEVEIGL
ncbi:MAG: FeoA family protein [Acholeplasmataceae bacterium]